MRCRLPILSAFREVVPFCISMTASIMATHRCGRRHKAAVAIDTTIKGYSSVNQIAAVPRRRICQRSTSQPSQVTRQYMQRWPASYLPCVAKTWPCITVGASGNWFWCIQHTQEVLRHPFLFCLSLSLFLSTHINALERFLWLLWTPKDTLTLPVSQYTK